MLAVSQVDGYLPLLPDFTDFDFYLLDKLEAVLQHVQVLDTRRYADYPEIRAFGKAANVTMLFLNPGSAEEPGRLVTPRGEYVTLSSVSALAEVLRTGDFDLFFVHYQAEGFEHYDVVSRGEDLVWNLRPESRPSMQQFIKLWRLPSFLAADDLVGARRHILQKLGHSPVPRSDDSSEGEPSSTSASSSASASSPEDSEGRDAEADEAAPPSAFVSGRASGSSETTPHRADAKSSCAANENISTPSFPLAHRVSAPVEPLPQVNLGSMDQMNREKVPPPPEPSAIPRRRRREHRDCKCSSCPSTMSSTLADTSGAQVSPAEDAYLR